MTVEQILFFFKCLARLWFTPASATWHNRTWHKIRRCNIHMLLGRPAHTHADTHIIWDCGAPQQLCACKFPLLPRWLPPQKPALTASLVLQGRLVRSQSSRCVRAGDLTKLHCRTSSGKIMKEWPQISAPHFEQFNLDSTWIFKAQEMNALLVLPWSEIAYS